MESKRILDAIGTLINGLPQSSSVECLLIYSAIRTLCQELEESNQRCEYMMGHPGKTIATFLEHCRGWVGLAADGREVEEHAAAARGAFAELNSDTCFRE